MITSHNSPEVHRQTYISQARTCSPKQPNRSERTDATECSNRDSNSDAVGVCQWPNTVIREPPFKLCEPLVTGTERAFRPLHRSCFRG